MKNAIAEVGSVPRVAKTAFGFPNGKSAEGVGPFSTSNYFTLPAGLLSIGAPLWITTIAKTGSGNTDNLEQPLLTSTTGAFGSRFGFFFAFRSVSATQYAMDATAQNNNTGVNFGPGGNVTPNTITTWSAAINGSTGYAKVNATAATTFATGGTLGAAAAGNVPRVGVIDDAALNAAVTPVRGQIFEIRVSTTAPSTALLDALHSAIFNNP